MQSLLFYKSSYPPVTKSNGMFCSVALFLLHTPLTAHVALFFCSPFPNWIKRPAGNGLEVSWQFDRIFRLSRRVKLLEMHFARQIFLRLHGCLRNTDLSPASRAISLIKRPICATGHLCGILAREWGDG